VGRLIFKVPAPEWACFLYFCVLLDAIEAKCSVASLALLGVLEELQADHAGKMS
jgi:hypothetical protein